MKNWLTPIIIASLLFVVVRPTFAQIAERQANLAQYLTANNVEVGIEVVDGYSQVYYVFEGQKTYVNKNNQNKRHPHSNGEYIVWAGDINGAGQIYLYHIPTNTIIQLTNSGTNLMPKVSKSGEVAWESWVDENWQVLFFDDKSVTQLTSGDMSRNPDVEGDYISYGRRDISGTWRSVVYSISKKEAKEVAIGISSKKPKVRDGRIILAGTGVEEVFPLTIEDLFLLNLSPLSTSPTPSPAPTLEVVTEEDIVEELQATSSAEMIDTATPSGEIQ